MEIKIQFTTDMEIDGDQYWEDAITKDGETPKQCAQRIVKYFNNTLRPGEKSRRLIGVREAPEIDISRPHDWEKTNSFTIMDKRANYDKYVCLSCRATGKRFGLNPNVTIDYRCRGKTKCPGAIDFKK